MGRTPTLTLVCKDGKTDWTDCDVRKLAILQPLDTHLGVAGLVEGRRQLLDDGVRNCRRAAQHACHHVACSSFSGQQFRAAVQGNGNVNHGVGRLTTLWSHEADFVGAHNVGALSLLM